MMNDAKPVVAVMRLRPTPGSNATWLAVWAQECERALHTPGCKSFRVLSDRQHAGEHYIVSEWDGAEGFDTFMRNGGIVWLERAIDGMKEPLLVTVLEEIPSRGGVRKAPER